MIEQSSLALIPRKVRRWLLLVVSLGSIAAFAAAVFLATQSGGEKLLSVALSVFQAGLIASALLVVFMLGQVSQSRNDIILQTATFLTAEFPESLRMYFAGPVAYPTDHTVRVIELINESRVGVRYIKGCIDARYLVSSRGTNVRLYLQFNVKWLTAVYSIAPELCNQVDQIFATTIAGAEGAGWTVKKYGVQRSVDTDQPEDSCELAFFQSFEESPIYSPLKRLFLSNDLAALTRSIVVSLRRLEQNDIKAVEPGAENLVSKRISDRKEP